MRALADYASRVRSAAAQGSTKLRDAEPLVRQAPERARADFDLKEHARPRERLVANYSEDWGSGPVA